MTTEKPFLESLRMVVQLLKMYIMLILICVIPTWTLQEDTQLAKRMNHGHPRIF